MVTAAICHHYFMCTGSVNKLTSTRKRHSHCQTRNKCHKILTKFIGRLNISTWKIFAWQSVTYWWSNWLKVSNRKALQKLLHLVNVLLLQHISTRVCYWTSGGYSCRLKIWETWYYVVATIYVLSWSRQWSLTTRWPRNGFSYSPWSLAQKHQHNRSLKLFSR